MMSTSGIPTAQVRRHLNLPGDPVSAAAARRAVREVLTTAGRSEWVEAAELACTEVVSNVVLHAHTDLELTIEVFAAAARVQVRDFSPLLPLQRDYNEQATTGRGMALVAAVTAEHGIADIGPDGKTVWFTIAGAPAQQSDDDLLAAWDNADWDLVELLGAAPPPDTGHTVLSVRLLGLPPTLWLAARQHHDALTRELVLYLAEHDVAGRDVDVPASDRARATISTAVIAAVEHAQQSGTARPVLPTGHPSPLPDVPGPLDLELQVPTALGRDFTALQDTLDTAERLAETGLLLVRPGLRKSLRSATGRASRSRLSSPAYRRSAGRAPIRSDSPLPPSTTSRTWATGTSRPFTIHREASSPPTTPTGSSRSAGRSLTHSVGPSKSSSAAAS